MSTGFGVCERTGRSPFSGPGLGVVGNGSAEGTGDRIQRHTAFEETNRAASAERGRDLRVTAGETDAANRFGGAQRTASWRPGLEGREQRQLRLLE